VDGKRAFSYMREGEEVELKAKELVIDKLEVLDLHLPEQGILSPHIDEVWKMARQNVSIKAQPADTTAQDDTARLEPETFADLRIRVVCSKGTYIRALARDIGEALGSGAYLIGLRRTRVGDITLDKCVKAADIEEWVGRIPLAPIPEEYKDLIIQK
jgi:tRNA pseudouridine55 synthase